MLRMSIPERFRAAGSQSSGPIDRAVSIFQTNQNYFEMMRDWHHQHGDCALEPRVIEIIERHCVAGARILDAGCGEGSATRWFARRHAICEFLGIDVSPIGISMASTSATANA